MPSLLGVDVGSTSLKAALLDLAGGPITSIRQRPFPGPRSTGDPLEFEIDISQVVARVRELAEELLPAADDCRGLVMCGQMGGLAFSGPRGELLSPYFSWRDQRVTRPHPRGGGSYFDVYSRRLSPADRRAIGGELRPGSTSTLLFWLAEQGLGLPAGGAPVTLVDAVLAALCGCPPFTGATQALGMLDLSTRDWNAAVVEAAGLAGVPRSRLLPDDAAGGEFVCAGRRLPCFPAVGDQQAALLGVQLNVGELSINSSTGSQVGVLTEQLELGDYQTRPFFKGKWLNTLTHLPAGRSLNVLVELLSALAVAQGRPLEDPWSHIARSAESAQDSELVVDLSFFAGPLGDHGAIRGITTENLTVGGLFRAAFRNMAENYECCARRLRPLADWPAVVLSGGLPQKIPILRELIAQRYTAPVRLSEATEETLLGLQVLARRIFAAEASTASAGS